MKANYFASSLITFVRETSKVFVHFVVSTNNLRLSEQEPFFSPFTTATLHAYEVVILSRDFQLGCQLVLVQVLCYLGVGVTHSLTTHVRHARSRHLERSILTHSPTLSLRSPSSDQFCCCLSLRSSLVAHEATCLLLCVFDRRPS